MTNNARRTAATQSTSTTTQPASAARTSNQRYTDKRAQNPAAASPIEAFINGSLPEWREFQQMQARAPELQYDLDSAWFALGVPVLREAMRDLEDAAAARANDPEQTTEFARSLIKAMHQTPLPGTNPGHLHRGGRGTGGCAIADVHFPSGHHVNPRRWHRSKGTHDDQRAATPPTGFRRGNSLAARRSVRSGDDIVYRDVHGNVVKVECLPQLCGDASLDLSSHRDNRVPVAHGQCQIDDGGSSQHPDRGMRVPMTQRCPLDDVSWLGLGAASKGGAYSRNRAGGVAGDGCDYSGSDSHSSAVGTLQGVPDVGGEATKFLGDCCLQRCRDGHGVSGESTKGLPQLTEFTQRRLAMRARLLVRRQLVAATVGGLFQDFVE
jgi:hypothetical protein